MSNTKQQTDEKTSTSLEVSWQVIVHNDPVNTFQYVILALMTVLKLNNETAIKFTNAVHNEGESVVWSGSKELAEHFMHELQTWTLTTSIRN